MEQEGNMIQIKNRNPIYVGEMFDFELEDGTLLHDSEWNGECYTVKEQGGHERSFRPVYRALNEFEDQFEIIGFEE